MNNIKQYSFSEMAKKQVVNVADGRELGHVCDMIFSSCGRVLGLVVPGRRGFFKSIATNDNIFIGWNHIIKIGTDVILVELVGTLASTLKIDNESEPTVVEPNSFGFKPDENM